MMCPDCKILEMRVEKVIDDEIHYVCKKCGKEITKSAEELENEEKATHEN